MPSGRAGFPVPARLRYLARPKLVRVRRIATLSRNATPEIAFPFGNCGSCSGSAAGHPMPVAPDFTSTARATYAIPLAIGEIDLNADDSYNSGWWAAPDNIARQGAYNFVNASVDWTSASGHYRVSLWAKNLGNEAVASASGRCSSAISRRSCRPERMA